jgi:AcrR family transcriptional regulator
MDTSTPERRPRGSRAPRQFSALTRAALVDVAQDLFSHQGYASTSLDAIVSGADVTKGALYHHFSSKQALFEAVFQRLEEAAADDIERAMQGVPDPWQMAQAGLRAFLEVVQRTEYRRIVLQDGPAVLGAERWRAEEEKSTVAIVMGIIRSVVEAGTFELPDEMAQTFGRVFYGALSAAGAEIAASEDPAEAAARAEAAVTFILLGLQRLADEGEELPDHRA